MSLPDGLDGSTVCVTNASYVRIPVILLIPVADLLVPSRPP